MAAQSPKGRSMPDRMLLRTAQARQPVRIGASWKPPGQRAAARLPACPVAVSDRRYPMRNREYYRRCENPCGRESYKAASHRKTGPSRVRFKFVGAGADYHLPEGNTASVSIAIWEDR